MKFFVVLLIQISIGIAFAGGSRVGNGSGDNESKVRIVIDKSFEIDSVYPFTNEKVYPDGTRLEGLPEVKFSKGILGASQPSIEKQKIDFMKIEEQRPELSNLEKNQLLDYFNKNGWKDLSVNKKCAVAKVKENSDLVTAAVIWGPKKGYLATGPNSDAAKKALIKMTGSTFIYDKDCSWK